MALLSARAVEANRRNAQLSTGPKTAAGKERSRCNATTHGLSAVATIYQPMRNENPQDFFDLRARLVADHQPVTTAEHLAIEMAAAAYKRIQRVEAMEVEYCDAAKAAIQKQHGQEPHTTHKDYLGAAVTIGDKENGFTYVTLDRWRRAAWSDYNKAIAQLTMLKRERVLSEVRELRLHKQYQEYLERTHVATQRAVQPTTSASFRHRSTAQRLLGRHWRKNGLHAPKLRRRDPAESPNQQPYTPGEEQ